MSVITSQPQVATSAEVLSNRVKKNQKENKSNNKKPDYLAFKESDTHKGSKDNNEVEGSRRRSISTFTWYTNASLDQPKKRSSSNRKSVSYPLNGNSNSNTIETFTRRSSLDISKTRTKSISQTTLQRPNSRFFSSPQFSTSTPNLITKPSKYIDNELRTSYHSVKIHETDFIIPTYVYKCIEYIKTNQPVEGLFRMNGSIKQVNLLELELNRNIDSFSFNNDASTSIHDVAVILKRWIAKLDYGLITASVCHLLTLSQKNHMHSMLSDYPSDIEDDESKEDQNELSSDANSEIEIINMDQCIKISDSPIKKLIPKSKSNLNLNALNIATTESNVSTYSTTIVSNIEAEEQSLKLPIYKSIYSSSLSKLPIENLHLLLVLLDFLNYLSKPEISIITKMHDLNLAKIFQLNIFKSVDLTINSRSFSTDDLKSSYTTHEELLTSMINDSDTIITDLSYFIKHEKTQMDEILMSKQNNSPAIASPNHKLNFSNNLFYKKKNSSTNSFTNTSTDFYSLTFNNSSDNIPQNVFKSKDTTTFLEPCIEKDVLTNPSTPIIDSDCHDFTNLSNELNNENDVIFKSHLPGNESPSDFNQGNESHTELSNRRPSHSKRKSLFGIFNKRKSIVSSVKNNDDIVTNNQNVTQNVTDPSADITNTHHENSTSISSSKQQAQNKKPVDMKRQLQDLNPTEENSVQQEHQHSKSSPENDKSNINHNPVHHEKNNSSQRRFSLFKFKRSM